MATVSEFRAKAIAKVRHDNPCYTSHHLQSGCTHGSPDRQENWCRAHKLPVDYRLPNFRLRCPTDFAQMEDNKKLRTTLQSMIWRMMRDCENSEI